MTYDLAGHVVEQLDPKMPHAMPAQLRHELDEVPRPAAEQRVAAIRVAPQKMLRPATIPQPNVVLPTK
jgi:hypothetical protein